jgi:hypothetical protein
MRTAPPDATAHPLQGRICLIPPASTQSLFAPSSLGMNTLPYSATPPLRPHCHRPRAEMGAPLARARRRSRAACATQPMARPWRANHRDPASEYRTGPGPAATETYGPGPGPAMARPCLSTSRSASSSSTRRAARRPSDPDPDAGRPAARLANSGRTAGPAPGPTK